MRRACGRATIVQGIALLKGGVIGHGVGGGVNISIEYAFRNLDMAQFLEVLFGVADIWYVLPACDCDNNEGKGEGREKSVRGRQNVELLTSRRAHVDLRLPFRQTTSSD